MKMRFTRLLLLPIFIGLVACNTSSKTTTSEKPAGSADSVGLMVAVFQSDILEIYKLSEHCYVHVSYFDTEEYGRVACNGMLVVHGSEAAVFDTPTDSISAAALIRFALEELHATIQAVIPTHFHEDCVGGMDAFVAESIPSFASERTIKQLRNKTYRHADYLQGFGDQLTLSVGNKEVNTLYFGAGHTIDNVIGIDPTDGVVFGGCLIKSMSAGKGNLEDADTMKWSQTVRMIKQQFTEVMVVPGHGKSGGTELFDYTIQMFQ